jgi:hypothetical protein
MNPSHSQPFEPQWFLPLFVLMWVTICALLSIIGGWLELARQYQSHNTSAGQKYYLVSGSLGWPFFPVSYGNCLSVTVSHTGIGLSVLFPFRVAHPPLLIPWLAVASAESRRFLFFDRTVIALRDSSRQLTIHGKAGKAILQEYSEGKKQGWPNQAL